MTLSSRYSALVLIAVFTFFSTNSNAGLITNINSETVSYVINTGNFGWRASYDIGFVEQDLLIDVDVFLTGDDPGNDLRNIWEQGIENVWSSAFDIFDGTYYYDILFNIDWLSQITGADHVVNVTNGSGNVSLVQWYTDNPSGWGYDKQGIIAAHEFGHMIGLFDEYNGGALDPITGLIRPNSIMGENLTVPQPDHFDALLSWTSLNADTQSLSLVNDQGNHFYDVSEPNIVMLFIILLLSLSVRGKVHFRTIFSTCSTPRAISH